MISTLLRMAHRMGSGVVSVTQGIIALISTTPVHGGVSLLFSTRMETTLCERVVLVPKDKRWSSQPFTISITVVLIGRSLSALFLSTIPTLFVSTIVQLTLSGNQ